MTKSAARVEQPVKLSRSDPDKKWCVFDLHDLVVRIEVKEKCAVANEEDAKQSTTS